MKRILLLYTGGTIGCEGAPLAPMNAGRFASRLASLGPLPALTELRALPRSIDSACIQPADWLDVHAQLLDAWRDFDGFVVLHGTDTLAYTAAALSFLLAGQDKPVVLTGSQHPLDAGGSDADRNLREAIQVACCDRLHEVAICFAGRILRGNRCVKRSASALDAFDSPNWPALGSIDADGPQVDESSLLPRTIPLLDIDTARARTEQLRMGLPARAVWLLHFHPGFPVAMLQAALALPEPPQGWVLACYGTGNVPESAELLAALTSARHRGVAMIAITQTGHGMVQLDAYRSGAALGAVGVIAGRDLTVPAAVAKLQLLLAANVPPAEIGRAMVTNLAGEIS